jgi:DNA segregation ATPase FtsK/SpoIIIE, S-DNA-T family
MSGTSSYYADSIQTIRKTVAEYLVGLARIEREFKQACTRMEQSICGLRKDSEKHGESEANAQEQEKSLLRQASGIEREIAGTQDRIAAAEQGIAAVESDIRALAQEKIGLERQIGDRWLILKIYYYFAEEKDKARHRCRDLQYRLDSATNRKPALEETKREFEIERVQSEARRTELEQTLGEIRQKLAGIEKSKGWNAEQARRLAEEKKTASDNRQKRRANWLTSFADQWKRTPIQVDQVGSSLRRRQPEFIDLDVNPPLSTEMPRELLLGSQKVSFEEYSCLVPHSIPFPFTHALVLPEDNEAQRRLAHHLLLRMLSAIPPGQLQLTLIDPMKLGQSVGSFLSLLKVEQLVPQQRVLTRPDEIEAALSKLTAEVEELIQDRFNDKEPGWLEFNANHADNPLPYRVVLLFDVPQQLSEKSLWFLERLCENGPRCGVLPIIAIDGSRVEDRRFESFRTAVKNLTARLDSLLHCAEDEEDSLSFAYKPEQWPEQDALEMIISTLAERHAAMARFSKTMPDLWSEFSKGARTTNGFEIPIGFKTNGKIASLRLGATDSEHHALLAGKTGSGKSNLLHVIIHSLCERYSPDEVDLYLLDYKESTEFTVYAKPPLPHARLVATESDPEYGVNVLQHLTDELERRGRIFKTKGVRDFATYRTEIRSQLPRILLVIDEFQVLFSDSRQVGEVSEQLLSQLLKQGRSFGIHVLLATQTLKNIKALSIGAIVSQLGSRIALACGQEDSALILGSNNCEAAELQSPPEGIINDANGAKSGNIKFLIPLAENGFCRERIAKLSERAAKRGLSIKTRVFDGTNLPFHPSIEKYQSLCGQKDGLLVGETLTFTADTMTVPLTTRNAFNILISGYDDTIHDGLLASTLYSLGANEAFEEVIYFNGRGIETAGILTEAGRSLGTRLKLFNDVDDLPLQEILNGIGKSRTALIVDGLDSERSLHPGPAFKALKPGEPSSPAELLKRIADEGPRKGTFVFAVVDNWRRCAGPCKELFGLFELRVAFCMNEDDAGVLVSGGIGKFKGIERPNRAVFVNRMTNEIQWFRPFAAKPDDEL